MKFFRGNRSTKELIESAKDNKTKPFVDQRYLDMSNGCEDSCEVFSSEQDIEDMISEEWLNE